MNSRQQDILKALAAEAEIDIAELAGRFSVAEMTIRRDLAFLEDLGKVSRTWGGARLAHKAAFEFTFAEKTGANTEEKKAIGCKASELVNPGDFVFLDTGTTALQVAAGLKTLSNITVITCSMPIVSELFAAPGIETIVLGGRIQPDCMELYGPITEKNISAVHANICFLGTDAVGSAGELLTANMETARVSELIIKASRKKVLVADHSKWENTAPIQYATLKDIDTVITSKRLKKQHKKTVKDFTSEPIFI